MMDKKIEVLRKDLMDQLMNLTNKIFNNINNNDKDFMKKLIFMLAECYSDYYFNLLNCIFESIKDMNFRIQLFNMIKKNNNNNIVELSKCFIKN